jgi:gamma-glutamylcyclotransferase
MLYFAYCTLLDVDEMRKYCPSAEPTEVAGLPGHRVAFARYAPGDSGGGCNLEEIADEEVLGLLFRLSPGELQALDSIAGVHQGYYKKIDVSVTAQDGRVLSAITYVIPNPLGAFQPKPAYTRPILRGAKALRLPPAYIRRLEGIIRSAQEAQS